MIEFALLPLAAILNRARGSAFWTLISLRAINLSLSMAGIASATAYIAWLHGCGRPVILAVYLFATLLLWCVFGWGRYFVAATGASAPIINETEFAPVDLVMKIINLPIDTVMRRRVWGIVAMGLRQGLIIPAAAGMAFIIGAPLHALFSFVSLLFGLFYFIGGSISAKNSIAIAEYLVGTGIAAIFLSIIML